MSKNRTTADPTLDELSDRLREVLEMLSQGMTSKEIAKGLKKENGEPLSPSTIKHYRDSLLSRFRARNTAELVFKAYLADSQTEANPCERALN
jgi:DNA-binding NarL/FixJ family response regulator